MTDLADLDLVSASNDGANVNLFHPSSGKDLKVCIVVAGKDSDKYKDMAKKLHRSRLAKAKKSNGFNPDIYDYEDDATKIMAACTISWEGVVFDKKKLECNAKNAEMLYKARPWIREQIDLVVQDRENFMMG